MTRNKEHAFRCGANDAIRAAVGGEAVAYRYRHSLQENWHYGPHPQSWWECQPLYASPPATVDVVAIRKALNDIREAVTQEPEDKFGYSQVDHGSGIPRAYSVRENILCTIDNRLAALIAEAANAPSAGSIGEKA